MGEHLGYAFVCIWMALISVGLLRARLFPRWVGVFGLAAAAVYSLAHGELLATVIPGFPAWGLAGLLGSLCWLAWMIVLGSSCCAQRPSHVHSRSISWRQPPPEGIVRIWRTTL
jgi:hypothetical protein